MQAQYFDTPDLSGPALVRVDANVDFDWTAGSPAAAISADAFSARWSGQIEAQFSETHSFIVNADDGARLWVNGQLLIDQFTATGVTDATATIDLIAGRRYDLQLEYREDTGNASVRLEWSSASLPREVIPKSQLHAASRGSLTLERWNGISGTSLSDLTGDPDFPDSPDLVSAVSSFDSPANIGDSFGQRLRGYVHASTTGPYRFFIAADEVAELWLSNTSDSAQKQLIASVSTPTAPQDWTAAASQRSAVLHLVAGQHYYIEALHKEGSGADHLSVGWQPPGQSSVDVIPGESLSPIEPTVRIYAESPTVAEGSSATARFTLLRSGAPLNHPLTVAYHLSGDATNGTDYTLLPGSITIPAGAESVELNITPSVDAAIEGDESVVIELQAGAGYRIGLQSERTVYGKIQDDRPAPAGGTTLWNGTALSDFSYFGGSFSTVSGNIIQAVISSQPASVFSVQLRQAIDSAVNAGDILWAEFRIRSIGGPGEATVIFERNGSPFTKSLNQGIPVTTDWTKIQLPFYAAESYAAGEANFGFHLGHQIQTLQFTDFQLLNYGPPRALAPDTDFHLNNISGTWGTSQTVSISGQPFGVAFEVQTITQPTANWHLQAVERNTGVVNNGDVMRVEFYMRSIAGANPRAALAMQRTDNFSSLFNNPTVSVGADWQFYSFDITANDDFDPNGLQFVFNLGYAPQTVQIGGFKWTNLANAVNLDELPRQFPASSYDGRGGTDAWRAAANDRIAADRIGDLTVHVTDANGRPLDGAVVGIRQSRHAFLFGSAINAFGGKLDPAGNAQALKYQSEIKRLFNTVVLENSHKWPGFLNDRQRGLDAADFAIDNGLYLRGHNVIWPSRNHMPSSVWSEYDGRVISDGQAAADNWLRDEIEARVADVVTTFAGKAGEWDVVNEPWSNHDVMDILGDGIVVDWYQQMRDADPNIKLVLNDFAIFASNGSNTNHRSNFDYWLGLLSAADLLDIIGEQSHYNDANLTDIDVLGTLIDDYHTQFSAAVAITEFDVDTADLQLQADYLRDYMTMSFSQSAVTEFLHWGFWQSSHWLPDAALYRSDFSIKPNGQAYEDLVFGQWWTDTRGTTRGGSVSAKAFLGEYDIVVQYAGQSYPATVTVDDSGTSSVTVNVPTAQGNDFGDAPAPFPTWMVDDGAAHVALGPRLGAERDGEADGLPSAGAVGDDINNLDDEDGVQFGVLQIGNSLAGINLDLQKRAHALVDAWLDFDGDGIWQNDEQILTNVLVNDVAGFQTFNFSINSDAVAGDTYARVRVSSFGNLLATGFAYDGEVEDHLVTILDAAPSVQGTEINGGADQRSNVTEIVVTFDSEVTAPPAAFEIKQRGTNTILDTLAVNSTLIGGQTVSTLSFGSGGNLVIDRASGGNSLVDGNYELTIDAAQIAKVGGGPNLLADYTLGAEATDNFFRFFGDHDGDRDADTSDLPAFGNTFRKKSGDVGFDPLFDFGGDNDVDTGDLVQFGQRFRQSLPFS